MSDNYRGNKRGDARGGSNNRSRGDRGGRGRGMTRGNRGGYKPLPVGKGRYNSDVVDNTTVNNAVDRIIDNSTNNDIASVAREINQDNPRDNYNNIQKSNYKPREKPTGRGTDRGMTRGNRGRGDGLRGNKGRGRGQTDNARDRGYSNHIQKKEKPPPTVYFIFDGIVLPKRYGNINLKTLKLTDVSEEDRLRIIDYANDIIDNFTPQVEEPEPCTDTSDVLNSSDSF